MEPVPQLPDLLSNTLEVVKLTSLGSVVAVPELLYQTRQAQSITYNPTWSRRSSTSCCYGRWYGY